MAPLIELEHLFDALQGFRRPLREGRLAVENIVQPVGVRPGRHKRFVNVEAMVIRTTKVNEPAVLVKVTLDKEATKVNEKINFISCQCPAGACKQHCCKHAMAVLIYLEKHDESELEILTCTDVQQIWGSISERTLTRFAPVPMQEFCCMKKSPSTYKRVIADVTPEMEAKFRTMYLAAVPESEAASFLSCRRERVIIPHTVPEIPHADQFIPEIMNHALSNSSYILERMAELGGQLYQQCCEQEKEFYNKYIKVTKEEAARMCADSLGQDNELWKMFKYGRITGSLIYSQYTYSKNKSSNWPARFESIFKSSFHGNDNTDVGLMYEDDARECYSLKYSRLVATAGIIVNPLVPWLGFSPDGIVIENSVPTRLWENKTPAKGRLNDAQVLGNSHTCMKDGKLKERNAYYGQVQLGMLLTGVSICDFCLYSYGFDGDKDLNKRIYVDPIVIDEPFLIDMLERVTYVFFQELLPWLVSVQAEKQSDQEEG